MVGVMGTGVIEDMDTGVIEGGDMECSRSFPLCSVPVQPSTGYTVLARLTIVTVTGMIITKTLALDPNILSDQDSTTTCQISVTVSTLPHIGSGGDDE